MTDLRQRLFATGKPIDREAADEIGRWRDRAAMDKAEIERLRKSLQAMLDTHGNPHREEWLNDAAFEHAQHVDAEARAALSSAPGSGAS